MRDGQEVSLQPECIGKSAWRGKGAAAKVAKRIAQAKHRNVEAYACQCCGMWHVGQPHPRRKIPLHG